MFSLNRACSWIAVVFIPVGIWAQIILPWDSRQSVPDFGMSGGPTVYLNYARPFGYPGVRLTDFSDLTQLNLINGQPDRLLSPWWIEPEHYSAEDKFGPSVFTETDTAAPREMINYKQGDSEFKDFSFTYQRALSPKTYLGIASETRSHVRYIDVIDFDQQNHEFQYLTESETQNIRVRIGYNRLRTPLYTLVFDSISQINILDVSAKLKWDRYTGSIDAGFIHGKNQYRFVLYQQGGDWYWADSVRTQWNSLTLGSWRHEWSSHVNFSASVGYWSQSLGEWHLKMPLTEASLKYASPAVEMLIGMKSIGSTLLPQTDVRLHWRKSYVAAGLVPIFQYDLPRTTCLATSVGQLVTGVKDSTYAFEALIWQGLKGLPARKDSLRNLGGNTAGWSVTSRLDLNWHMRLSLGYEKLIKGSSDYYTFDTERLTWGLEQHLYFFNKALLASLRAWGSTHFNTRSGRLNRVFLDLEPPFALNSKPLYRINYSIEARISEVTIAFTDRNVFQDAVWQPYLGADWPTAYTFASNIPMEDRFRYLTVVWYFTN